LAKIQTPRDAQQSRTIPVGRGVFLGVTGLTGLGLGLAGVGVNVGRILPNLSNLLPGQNINGFTIYTITGGFPSMKAADYRLKINGLVNNPKTYTLNDLLAMPAIEETRYYQCVTGWVVPRPRWRGVRLWDLLQAAGIKSEAVALHFNCFDGAYTESLTLDQARQPDVLLAYSLDGKPLAVDQGYPLRLVVPGMYGYKFAKWVNEVTVTDTVIPGYWEQNGYDVNAYIGRSNGY